MATLERCGALLQPYDQAGSVRSRRAGAQLGRIGTNGRELVEEFAGEIEAGQMPEGVVQAKRRRRMRPTNAVRGVGTCGAHGLTRDHGLCRN